MTATPTETKVSRLRIALPEAIVSRVRDAVTANTEGLRDAILAVVGNVRAVHQLEDGSWPTIERREWLSYEWVAGHNPGAAWPTTDHGAKPGDRLIGLTETLLPGATVTTPETRTAAFAEDFTGALTGAPWPTSRWMVGIKGGSATVLTEEGRLTSGATGGYDNDSDATGIRALMASVRDVELRFDVELGATSESELRIHTRTGEADMHMASGVAVAISQGRVVATAANAWAYKKLAEKTKTHTPGTSYSVRLIVATQEDTSTLIRVRTWPTSDTEPGTWDIDTTTTEPGTTQPGYWGFYAPGIGDPASNEVLIDNIRMYTRPPASTPDWWGTWAG